VDRLPLQLREQFNAASLEPGSITPMYRVYQTFIDRLAESADVTTLREGMAETIRALVGRFLGSNRMLAGTEVVKCPCEMRAWSLSTKVLL
jgi:hypothetical protein